MIMNTTPRLTHSTSIQFNLFKEENVSQERFLELKKCHFLFNYEFLIENSLIGIFEDVCSYNGINYYRSVSFNNVKN